MTPNAYSVIPGWEQLPDTLVHRDVSDVAIDAQDRVFVVTRYDARVLVYEASGAFIHSFGEELLSDRPHGITVDPLDQSIWIVDEGDQTVGRWTPEGQRIAVIGTSGLASNTGADWSHGYYDYAARAATMHGGPPFNHPTALAVSPDGDLFVSDGYGNSRIHRFSRDGELLSSFGEPGIEPGEFNLPHCVVFDNRGYLLVADRENDRIQVLTPDGEFVQAWDVQRPNGIALGPDGLIYVAHSAAKQGTTSIRHGTVEHDLPSTISVLAPDGQIVSRIGGDGPPAVLGNFAAAHGLALDSNGDLYVAEVTYSSRWRELVPAGHPTLHKLTASASKEHQPSDL
jgi:DNA-binding beta-propeller fold protein YncE